MHVTIIGASSGIGLNTVNLAIAKGHHVTTLSRSAQSIPDSLLINRIIGDATRCEDIMIAIFKADVVIISVGKKGKGSDPGTLFSNTAKALLQAVKKINFTKPVLIVTGFGAGDSANYQPLFIKIIFNLFLKAEYADKTRMEKLITESTLKWEIIRPGMLTNKPPTGNYSVYTELKKGIKIGSISRYDVANFLLNQAETPTLIGKYISLTSP